MILSSLKLHRPLAVLDLETTGVDPRTDRIVEIAVLKVHPDQHREQFHLLVNPGIAIPESASRIHGITNDDVCDAPEFRDIAGELAEFLDGADLAGFGITAFDLPLLVAEFARVGYTFRIADRYVVDAMTIYHRFHPRDLSSAVRHYLRKEHVQAHCAMNDVEVTLEVLDRQVGEHGLPTTLARLHNAFVEVDVSRRFQRGPNGEIVFAFGKHLGKRLAEVALTDRGYLDWMLNLSLLDDTRTVVEVAIAESRKTRCDNQPHA